MGEFLERPPVLGYLLLTPALVILVGFVGYPFLYGIWLSLSSSRIGKPGHFVGLENFHFLLSDDVFLHAARNSVIYTIGCEIIKFVLGLILALMMNREFPLKRFVRAGLLLPWIVPTVLSVMAWLWILDPTFSVINWLLVNLRLVERGPNLLYEAPLACVVLVNVWRGAPFFGISFLAGMQTIPAEMYESADMDGAGRWAKFRHITLPMLRPVILTVLMLSTIFTFADFNLIYVLTRGGPFHASEVFATYAYQVGLGVGDIAAGAAIALFMFPVLCLLVAGVVWLQRRD